MGVCATLSSAAWDCCAGLCGGEVVSLVLGVGLGEGRSGSGTAETARAFEGSEDVGEAPDVVAAGDAAPTAGATAALILFGLCSW